MITSDDRSRNPRGCRDSSLPRVWGCPPIPGTPWNPPLRKGDGWQDRCSRMLPGFGVSPRFPFSPSPKNGGQGVDDMVLVRSAGGFRGHDGAWPSGDCSGFPLPVFRRTSCAGITPGGRSRARRRRASSFPTGDSAGPTVPQHCGAVSTLRDREHRNRNLGNLSQEFQHRSVELVCDLN